MMAIADGALLRVVTATIFFAVSGCVAPGPGAGYGFGYGYGYPDYYGYPYGAAGFGGGFLLAPRFHSRDHDHDHDRDDRFRQHDRDQFHGPLRPEHGPFSGHAGNPPVSGMHGGGQRQFGQ